MKTYTFPIPGLNLTLNLLSQFQGLNNSVLFFRETVAPRLSIWGALRQTCFMNAKNTASRRGDGWAAHFSPIKLLQLPEKTPTTTSREGPEPACLQNSLLELMSCHSPPPPISPPRCWWDERGFFTEHSSRLFVCSLFCSSWRRKALLSTLILSTRVFHLRP